MFERVVDRPEMLLTNEQSWILIRLTCVLATEVCLITSGLKEPFNVLCGGGYSFKAPSAPGWLELHFDVAYRSADDGFIYK